MNAFKLWYYEFSTVLLTFMEISLFLSIISSDLNQFIKLSMLYLNQRAIINLNVIQLLN